MTEPRNVQQAYFGSAAAVTSSEDTGTYSNPPPKVGVPVIVALGCGSTLTLHSLAPVVASTA